METGQRREGPSGFRRETYFARYYRNVAPEYAQGVNEAAAAAESKLPRLGKACEAVNKSSK
jgi:hypothetical protein